jgi:hypothetical protein
MTIYPSSVAALGRRIAARPRLAVLRWRGFVALDEGVKSMTHSRRRTTAALATALGVIILSMPSFTDVPAAQAASGGGLPVVGSGQRPGPDILYAAPPDAPQLQNTGVWKADPILVSGATAYRNGEFLYQDWLFDDRGAAGVPDPTATAALSGDLMSPSTGTATYPTDPVYAGNAADLVELRVKPLPDATAFRVTLNSMVDPELTAFTIALGTSSAPVPWPHGAGVASPAEQFVTVHGSTAQLVDAGSGRAPQHQPTVRVDLPRRQVEVRVPHASWNPGRTSVRLAVGTGLWDSEAGTYRVPGAEASARVPGGASPSRAALFNLAFRSDEPAPDPSVKGLGKTLGETAALARADGTWWREKSQAHALAAGDVTAFTQAVNFDKLSTRVNDDSEVPRTGAINRIFASHNVFGQGVDRSATCGRVPTTCQGIFQGQLQPYSLYVPAKERPVDGWGLTLLLHSLSSNYNEYTSARYQSQIGERGAGSLVLTPGSRGPDGDYIDAAEADVFEAWADVARHYPLDTDWTSMTGFSMGGGGSWRLAQRWPDLFARIAALGAAPTDNGVQTQWMASLRNVPALAWMGLLDEGAMASGDPAVNQKAIDALGSHGVQFTYDVFPLADHVTVVNNDQMAPLAAFLGQHRVERDPRHITYVVDPRYPFAGGTPDHAYWLSGMTVRAPGEDPVAHVDVRSGGFGTGDVGVRRTASLGTLDGGYNGPMPYQEQGQVWLPAPPFAKTNRLQIRATNLATLTIDPKRARVDCNVDLDVVSDGPVKITLTGCPLR